MPVYKKNVSFDFIIFYIIKYLSLVFNVMIHIMYGYYFVKQSKYG